MKTIIPVVKCEPVKLSGPTLNVEKVLEACGYKLMDARLQTTSYVMSDNMLTIFTQDTQHNIMCDNFLTEERGRLDLSRVYEADRLMKLCMLINTLLTIDRDKLTRTVAENLVTMPKASCSLKYIKDEIKNSVTKYVTEGFNKAKQYVIKDPHFAFEESYYTIKDSDIESLVDDATYSILYVLLEVYKARAAGTPLPFRAPSCGRNPTLFRVLSVIRVEVSELVEEAKESVQPKPTTKKKKWYQIF